VRTAAGAQKSRQHTSFDFPDHRPQRWRQARVVSPCSPPAARAHEGGARQRQRAGSLGSAHRASSSSSNGGPDALQRRVHLASCCEPSSIASLAASSAGSRLVRRCQSVASDFRKCSKLTSSNPRGSPADRKPSPMPPPLLLPATVASASSTNASRLAHAIVGTQRRKRGVVEIDSRSLRLISRPRGGESCNRVGAGLRRPAADTR
jgi:hypothetical protein